MQGVPGFEPGQHAIEVAARAFDALVAAVQRAMESGVIAEAPPTETAQLIWASIHGWVSLELLGIGFVEDKAAGYDRLCTALLWASALSAAPNAPPARLSRIRSVEVPMPGNSGKPHRLVAVASRDHAKAGNRALPALMVAIEQLQRERLRPLMRVVKAT